MTQQASITQTSPAISIQLGCRAMCPKALAALPLLSKPQKVNLVLSGAAPPFFLSSLQEETGLRQGDLTRH